MAPLLSVAEVAARWGRSERFVYRLVHERKLPFVKLGDRPRSPVMFEPADVEAYIAARKVEAVAS